MKRQNTIEIIADALPPVTPLTATDNHGEEQAIYLVSEQPLTIYLNRTEVVTVMTMGAMPAELIVGFLLNQQLIPSADDVVSIHVDWTVNAAAVYTKHPVAVQKKTEKRVVTSGCGQGTMFANVMQDLQKHQPKTPITPISSTQIYQLLAQLSDENAVYKQAGGVHSCALCSHDHVIKTVEDVGRHNAVDSLAGFMALNRANVVPTVLYTTGRLTSEMVIKTAQMGLPFVLSRSGATAMGVEIARQTGITLIARAKGKRFLLLTGQDNVIL